MDITVMGEPILTLDDKGELKCRIATIFVKRCVLVTLPGTHATQRAAFTSKLSAQRVAAGGPPLSWKEVGLECEDAVDLTTDGNFIQIRPGHSSMHQVFEADRILQEVGGISERRIRILDAREEKVQQAIRQRGEYWRITRLPQSHAEIVQMIQGSLIGIGGEPIYYYSRLTGTRYLTVQRFAALGAMDDDSLRRHLLEIREYMLRDNWIERRELDFFAVQGDFGVDRLDKCDLFGASAAEIRAWHKATEEKFRAAVPADLWEDSADNLTWRNLMFSCLIGRRDESISEEVLRGINPEFFMQIRWMPGGRIEHGELMFSKIFSEAEQNPCDPELQDLCDEKVKGFICNYVREFGNLEYVNIGRVAPSLQRHERRGGHRAYIAEVKHRGAPEPVVRIIRLQKWGIREHLDDGKDLLPAIMQSEEYTDYILDRRLGCWQLGMSLPGQIMTKRLTEIYRGTATCYHGTRIWTTYFERDYIRGVATDKIAVARYRDDRFALALARLLGRAAVPNIIIGRASTSGSALFDDGDEVLVMDGTGMPRQIIVADHTGTFVDCESKLERFAKDYAQPVLSRRKHLSNPAAFEEAYIASFAAGMTYIQDEYRRERRAFDTLFKQSKQDPGAFAWRWKKVLSRLDQTDVTTLVDKIREVIRPQCPVS